MENIQLKKVSEEKNVTLKSKKVNASERYNGLSLSFAFLLSGVISFWLPNFLGNPIATNSLVFTLISIGLLGLGIELNELNKSKRKVLDSDFAIGFVLIIVWIFTYHFFKDPLLNLVYLSVFFFGVYGISRGTLRLINEISKTKDRKTAIFKSILASIKFLVALLALYEALQKVGIF